MNETGSFVVIWMNLESVTQHKVSQKTKNKYCILTHAHVFIYIDIYIIWNLETWYRWTYLQRRNRDADVENGLVDTVGEGRVGQAERGAVEYIYALSKWLASEKLL